jgi:hypothetical protein
MGPNPLVDKKKCNHDYEEVSSIHDFDGETYVCKICGDRYRLYYEDMK